MSFFLNLNKFSFLINKYKLIPIPLKSIYPSSSFILKKPSIKYFSSSSFSSPSQNFSLIDNLSKISIPNLFQIKKRLERKLRTLLSSETNKKKSQNNNEGLNTSNNNNENNPNNENSFFIVTIILWLLSLIYIFTLRNINIMPSSQISWNEFVTEMLSKGEVEAIRVQPESENLIVILHPNAVVKGRQIKERAFYLKMGEFQKFEDKLREAEKEIGIPANKSVPVIYERSYSILPRLVVMGIVLCFLFMLKKNFKFQFPNPSDMFSNERKANFVRVDLLSKEGKAVKFSDVAGLHEPKVEIMEFVDYLKSSEKYEELGVTIPKGVLMLGPPGCGKTLLAKAVATEAKVPFLAMAGSEFVEMFGGLGAARVRDLFKEARKRAPCIIYIDEIDAVGRKRSGDNWSHGTEDEHTLNQLLVEMDGMATKQNVIILASTNRPDILDKALLRAGRFDRHITIDMPTLAERKEIFEIYLKKLKLKSSPSSYSDTLAQMSPGMSGADINNICNEAALHAARLGNKMVDEKDFDYAVERVTAGIMKKSRVLSKEERNRMAIHEAGHAVVGWNLISIGELLKISIIPRTNNLLGYSQYSPKDQKLYSSEDLFEKMCLLLGGRVAESIIFNHVSSGAEDDLKKVTQIAYDKIKLYGMNKRLGLISYPNSSNFEMKPYSKQMLQMIDNEAQLLITKAYKRTEKIIINNKEKLKHLAEALVSKETLTYKDIEQLLGPRTFS